MKNKQQNDSSEMMTDLRVGEGNGDQTMKTKERQ